MKQSYDFNIEKINNLSLEEKDIRKKNLDLFYQAGFPNKKNEDWKFTDLSSILNKGFKNITNSYESDLKKKFEIIQNFEHNYIILGDGKISSNNFKYEENGKILIKDYNQKDIIKPNTPSSLTYLNNALSTGGFSLEITKNYKLKKPVVVYNYFSNNLKNTILNNKNSIILNEGAELTLIDYSNDSSQDNFIKNTIDNVSIKENAILKNILIQDSISNGHFYKYIKVFLKKNSQYENYILSSGLKFNKVEIEVDLNEENSSCGVYSALNLLNAEHQEIKTRINHNAPNCRSYQKIKNVLNDSSKGIFQGKIFVKSIAQKTDAYQLSKALIVDNSAEFDAKPELEIYADDVKCSHGSTSGSVDLDSIHYLMTRGISEKNALKLLINGFLCEVLESITDGNLKNFLEEKLKRQINGY